MENLAGGISACSDLRNGGDNEGGLRSGAAHSSKYPRCCQRARFVCASCRDDNIEANDRNRFVVVAVVIVVAQMSTKK